MAGPCHMPQYDGKLAVEHVVRLRGNIRESGADTGGIRRMPGLAGA